MRSAKAGGWQHFVGLAAIGTASTSPRARSPCPGILHVSPPNLNSNMLSVSRAWSGHGVGMVWAWCVHGARQRRRVWACYGLGACHPRSTPCSAVVASHLDATNRTLSLWIGRQETERREMNNNQARRVIVEEALAQATSCTHKECGLLTRRTDDSKRVKRNTSQAGSASDATPLDPTEVRNPVLIYRGHPARVVRAC